MSRFLPQKGYVITHLFARRSGALHLSSMSASQISNAETMTSVPRRLRRALLRWVLLAALVLCAGQSVADAHLHYQENEEEVCTLCAISEPDHVPGVERVDARPFEWRLFTGLPVYSATLAPRPYEVVRPRAPPVS